MSLRTATSPLTRPLRCVIGLTGAAGAGKDTCGELLKPLGFRTLAFADPLRAEVHLAFNIDPSVFAHPDVKEQNLAQLAIWRSTDSAFVNAMLLLGHDVDLPRSPRWIMQRWGTEYRRTQNPGYWIRRLVNRIINDRQQGFGAHVITDVRLPNEADAVRALQGRIFRVHRPLVARLQADTRTHESERAPVTDDGVVHNDGGLDHLRSELFHLVVGVGVWSQPTDAAAA